MIEKIKFIERFIAARQKYLKTSDELSVRMQKQEVSYDAQVVLDEEITEPFKDFLRIDFMRIAQGCSRDTDEKTPLQLLEFMMKQLEGLILTSKTSSKVAMDRFKEYRLKDNLSEACREFCEMSIRFQSAFDGFLEAIMDQDKSYSLTSNAGIQLLKVLYADAFPHVPLNANASSNTATPRSGRITGDRFGGSPRVAGRGSPRDLMRSSGSPPPGSQATPGMWKRTSAGGDALSSTGSAGGRSPSLTHSSGRGDVKPQ